MTADAADTHDPELARLNVAERELPSLTGRYDHILARPDAVTALWRAAASDVQRGNLDDRPLYWARLKLLRRMRTQSTNDLVAAERCSRGFSLTFPNGDKHERKVLITGFDPFQLNREIGQSNPSGVAALALDDTVIKGARIRAAILPVRFEDFDSGIAEDLLARPFANGLALALTISMGREQFDLERFPGRRRSAESLDNRDLAGGGTPSKPVPPPGVDGPEFLENSLPSTAMTAARGCWPVRDNRHVRSLEQGDVIAESLSDLRDDTAVAGSSGGFLSNEIAYRSLRLQKRLGVRFPLGHVHTPKLVGHDAAVEGDMVEQIRAMIEAALNAEHSVHMTTR